LIAFTVSNAPKTARYPRGPDARMPPSADRSGGADSRRAKSNSFFTIGVHNNRNRAAQDAEWFSSKDATRPLSVRFAGIFRPKGSGNALFALKASLAYRSNL